MGGAVLIGHRHSLFYEISLFCRRCRSLCRRCRRRVTVLMSQENRFLRKNMRWIEILNHGSCGTIRDPKMSCSEYPVLVWSLREASSRKACFSLQMSQAQSQSRKWGTPWSEEKNNFWKFKGNHSFKRLCNQTIDRISAGTSKPALEIAKISSKFCNLKFSY